MRLVMGKLIQELTGCFTYLRRKENCTEHHSTCEAFPEVTGTFHASMQDSLDEYTI